MFNKKALAMRIAQQISAELSGSESLYGFCGWLTTQDEPTTMSAHDDAGSIAELVDKFCKTNKLAEPEEGWEQELIHPSKKASIIIHNFLEDSLAEGHLKQADYPDHPKDIVLPISDWSSRPVAEVDIWNYYSRAGKRMLSELKGRNLFIGVVPKGYKAGQKPIYIRHPYHGNTEYIRIGNAKEFEIYHSGRTVEMHVTMPKMAPYYIIDIDAPGKFSDTKKITAEVSDALGKIPEVKSVDIRYSGKRGFHTLGWLKKSRDVDDARNFLKGWLKETFGDRDDLVLGESPQGDKPALGLSPMKVNGGQVALWSLRVSGLCCIEVPRAQLMSFEREDASIDKTYKKLTGKAFPSEKIASAIPTTRIKELPGISLEEPTSKAVKALLPEKPFSSGWHSGFKPEDIELDPCWAVLFEGQISERAKRAAEKSGLKIHYRDQNVGCGGKKQHITDVYLPEIEKTDLEKATKIFDKFSEEYKELSKKVSSILYHHINEDAIIIKEIYA